MICMTYRFKQRSALRLVRMGEEYIGKMHGADLATKYNPVGQGLDIVEMAAIFGQLVDLIFFLLWFVCNKLIKLFLKSIFKIFAEI